MNENNANINVENKEVKSPIYSSKFLMNKELFYDFNLVTYNKIKKYILFCLCFSAFAIITNMLVGNYDIIGSTLFITLLALLVYCVNNKNIRVGYERTLLSEGVKKPTHGDELLEDRIISNIDELKREFFYFQVTGLFETDNFLLLHLKHNLFIVLNKSSLNASVDEVKAFLIKKCLQVKKKKFINCSNDKKLALSFLVELIVVTVVGTVVATILKHRNFL